MDTITISTENHETFSSISNFFIDYYMTNANGDFVKVYFYLVRLLNKGQTISVADIADHFDLTEKDICRAIRYWVQQEVLRLNYNEKKELTGITLLPLKKGTEKQESNITLFPQGNKSASKAPNLSPAKEDSQVPKKVQRSMVEIEQKQQQDTALSNIIYQLETYTGHQLTQTDLQILLYIYEDLQFSDALLEYLIEFCVTNNKKSLRYMESLAIHWYQEGITTVAEAKEAALKYNTVYVSVLKALGINRRSATVTETNFINTWSKELGFSNEIILEACKRAIYTNPHSANFPYVNGILENWHKQQVKTLSDIEQLDKEHQAKKRTASKKASSENQFNAFTQKKLDDTLDELDKLLLDEVNASAESR